MTKFLYRVLRAMDMPKIQYELYHRGEIKQGPRM